MQTIPISAVPSQKFNITLASQPCQISIYTLYTGLFMDVLLNNVPVCNGVLCQNNNRIVRASYSGFIGDLIFNDTLGTSDPVYMGLGTQYQLIYLEASDLATLGLV